MDSTTLTKFVDFLVETGILEFEEGKKRCLFQGELRNKDYVGKFLTASMDNVLEVGEGFESSIEVADYIRSNRTRALREINKTILRKKMDFDSQVEDKKGYGWVLKQEGLEIFSDPLTGVALLWDLKRGKPSSTTFEAFTKKWGNKVVGSLKTEGRLQWGRIVYNPYDLTSRKSIIWDDREIQEINTYTPPAWRFLEVKGELSPRMEAFFTHLFPVESERMLVFAFLKHAILYRVSHILVLMGNKGTGKSFFMDHIVENLIGKGDVARPTKDFFNRPFQEVLENNRMLIFDEIEVKTDKEKKDIKRLTNSDQGIEKKNVSTTKSQNVQVYYSTIFANNAPNDVYTEYDDRRLFYPEIAANKLPTVFSNEWIDDFKKECYSPEGIARLGNYLINDFKEPSDFSIEDAVNTPTFYKCVEACLKQTERFVVEYLMNPEHKGKFIEWEEIKYEYDTTHKNADKFFKKERIRLFLTNYLHRGKDVLGKWSRVEGIEGIRVGPIE